MMLFGLVEHHHTHFSSEWAYKRTLRDKRSKDRLPVLRAMLGEFGLLRCLQSGSGPKSVLSILNEDNLKDPLGEKDFRAFATHESIKRSSPKSKKPRSFLSGATKVLWFAHGHSFPMLDKWTKKALAANDSTFFSKLNHLDYVSARRKTVEALSMNPKLIGWFDASRFWDKVLFLYGLESERAKKKDENDQPWYRWRSEDLLSMYLRQNQFEVLDEVLEGLSVTPELGMIRKHLEERVLP